MYNHRSVIVFLALPAECLKEFAAVFEQFSFDVVVAASIAETEQIFCTRHVDAIVASPPRSGGSPELGRQLQRILERSACPLIILAATSDPYDAVISLETFAADYVDATISPRELIARVRAVVRRASMAAASDLNVGLLKISGDCCDVEYNGRRVGLTATEFKIVRLLAERVNAVVSREVLSGAMGATQTNILDRTVDAHVKNIRKKLGELGSTIETARGFGYRLRSAQGSALRSA